MTGEFLILEDAKVYLMTKLIAKRDITDYFTEGVIKIDIKTLDAYLTKRQDEEVA